MTRMTRRFSAKCRIMITIELNSSDLEPAEPLLCEGGNSKSENGTTSSNIPSIALSMPAI